MDQTQPDTEPNKKERNLPFATFHSSNRKFGLREILTEVFYNDRIFLTALFLPVFFSLALSLIVKETYTSEARLLVMMSSGHLMQGGLGAAVGLGGMGAQSQIVRAEAEILGSRTLRETTLRALGPDSVYPELTDLADNKGFEKALILAAENLEENFSIHLVPSTNIIALAFKHENPEVAALLLNTAIGFYLEQRKDIFADIGLEVLAQELKAAERSLSNLDEKMKELRNQAGVSDFASERQALINRLTRLELDQVRAEVDIQGLVAQVSELNLLINLIPQEVNISAEDAGLSALNQALDTMRKLEMERGKLIERFQKGSRFIDEIDKRLELANQSVDKMKKIDLDQKRTGRNVVYDEIQQDKISFQAKQKALEAETSARVFAILETKERLDALNTLETGFNQLQRRRLVLETNFKTFSIRYEQERMAKAVEANFEDSTIRVIEYAVPPIEGKSKRKAIIVLGFLGGIFLAALSLYFSRLTRTVMVTPEDVEEALSLPVLTTINTKRSFILEDE